MKNLLAIIAVAILGSAFALAVSPSTNTFTVTTTCPDITVTAAGFVGPTTSVVAGGADAAGTFVGTWNLANWGLGSIAAAPSAATASSLTLVHYTAVWTATGGTFTGGTYTYASTNTACNTTGTIVVTLSNVGAGPTTPAGTTPLAFSLTGSF